VSTLDPEANLDRLRVLTDRDDVSPLVELRRRAEEMIGAPSAVFAALSPEDQQRVLHDLRVHQIELEMQNEELRRAQVELEAERAHYFEFYELSPVAYLTVGAKGLITAANLTATRLLGRTRNRLIGFPLSQFIFADDVPIFRSFARWAYCPNAVQDDQLRQCELRVKGKGFVPTWASLLCAPPRQMGGAPAWDVAIYPRLGGGP